MLECTEKQTDAVQPEHSEIAELMATATMTSQLKQDLIDDENANGIVNDHRAGNSEEWRREIAACVAALCAVEKAGYKLIKF